MVRDVGRRGPRIPAERCNEVCRVAADSRRQGRGRWSQRGTGAHRGSVWSAVAARPDRSCLGVHALVPREREKDWCLNVRRTQLFSKTVLLCVPRASSLRTRSPLQQQLDGVAVCRRSGSARSSCESERRLPLAKESAALRNSRAMCSGPAPTPISARRSPRDPGSGARSSSVTSCTTRVNLEPPAPGSLAGSFPVYDLSSARVVPVLPRTEHVTDAFPARSHARE